MFFKCNIVIIIIIIIIILIIIIIIIIIITLFILVKKDGLVSQSTKVDRLVSIGDQHTRIYKILTGKTAVFNRPTFSR